jgi:hypothetical protein
LEPRLAPDFKLGLVYQDRRLGRVIEDVSTHGARAYLAARWRILVPIKKEMKFPNGALATA